MTFNRRRFIQAAGAGASVSALPSFALAQSSPNFLRSLAPWLYGIGVVLLVVDAIGYVGKGAQRWLDVGLTGGVFFDPTRDEGQQSYEAKLAGHTKTHGGPVNSSACRNRWCHARSAPWCRR